MYSSEEVESHSVLIKWTPTFPGVFSVHVYRKRVEEKRNRGRDTGVAGD